MVPTDEGVTTLDPEHAGALLYPGSSTVVQWTNAERLGPQPNATMTQEVDGAPASAIESTYVLCNQDRAVHPEHQRIMAARCSSMIEIDSDHSPFVDDPGTIASIIQRVVNA